MPQKKKNDKRRRKIIDMKTDTLLILDRYSLEYETDSKNLIQDCMDNVAELIKHDYPDMVREPRKESLGGLKGFSLPKYKKNNGKKKAKPEQPK